MNIAIVREDSVWGAGGIQGLLAQSADWAKLCESGVEAPSTDAGASITCSEKGATQRDGHPLPNAPSKILEHGPNR
jgi:hypothetical protein